MDPVCGWVMGYSDHLISQHCRQFFAVLATEVIALSSIIMHNCVIWWL